MAERKALVQIAGQVQELPVGDTLEGVASGGGGGSSSEHFTKIATIDLSGTTLGTGNEIVQDISGFGVIFIEITSATLASTDVIGVHVGTDAATFQTALGDYKQSVISASFDHSFANQSYLRLTGDGTSVGGSSKIIGMNEVNGNPAVQGHGWGSNTEYTFGFYTETSAEYTHLRFATAGGANATAGEIKVYGIPLSVSSGGNASYPDFAGNAGKALKVNQAEDGVEWGDDLQGAGGSTGNLKAVRAHLAANASIVASVVSILPMDSLGVNTLPGMSTSQAVYTVPAEMDGKLMSFAGGVRHNSGSTITLYMRWNRVSDTINTVISQAQGSGEGRVNVLSGPIVVKAGDIIQLEYWTTVSGAAAAGATWFSAMVEEGIKGDVGNDGAGVLNGGEQGAVLIKNSATDQDTRWGTMTEFLTGPIAAESPSYNHPLATGNRMGKFSVTTDIGGSSGTVINLFNGNQSDNAWYSSSAVTGKHLTCEFPYPVLLEEIRWRQSNTTQHTAVFNIEGSDDGIVWNVMGTGWNVGGTATDVFVMNSWNGTTAYKYIRMIGTAGAFNTSPWIHEIEFKIGNKQLAGIEIQGNAPEGGTTGQALLKTSDNDHEYAWGDIDLTNWGAATELLYPTTTVGNSGAAHFMRGNVFTALQDMQITSMDFKSIGVYDYEMFVAITTEGADPTSAGAEIVEYRGVGGTLTSVADQNIVQRITMVKPAIIRAGERFTIGTIRRTGTSSGMMVASNAASDPFGNDELLYTRRTLQFSSEALGSNPADSSWNGTYYWMQIQYLPVAPVVQSLKIGQISGDTTLTVDHFNGVTHWEVTGTAILTVPNLSPKYPATFEAIDANEVSFVAGSGATVNSFADQLKLAGQYAAGTLVPKGNGVYTLIGNTKA